MILDLHVGPPRKGAFCTGKFHIHKGLQEDELHGIMTLNADICEHCCESYLGPEHWTEILCHEITELVAVSIVMTDKRPVKWNAHGYNRAIAWAMPLGIVDHTCPCGCEYTIRYAR